jgi:hypothetical protein
MGDFDPGLVCGIPPYSLSVRKGEKSGRPRAQNLQMISPCLLRFFILFPDDARRKLAQIYETAYQSTKIQL